jgi:hypothetical protein
MRDAIRDLRAGVPMMPGMPKRPNPVPAGDLAGAVLALAGFERKMFS